MEERYLIMQTAIDLFNAEKPTSTFSRWLENNKLVK